ncbi:hypothetical protein [uncultured Christiangramia sp.]|uniref:hypothetical protein n=1 Tax=Christiangramia sp. 3-2217-3z TaxID=3417564 RepID=UPI00262D88EA|nr:hypothetical protein [uncultured Christiangramia sp.]
MRKSLLQILILTIIIGCSPKIKSITEYKKNENHLSKNRIAELDKNGNKFLERNYGNQRSNRIERIEYKNGKKIKETDCDYFEKQDTCVVRQFSVYEYLPKENLKIQTMYEADSAVRFIRKYRKTGDLEVIKTNTWEMFPTKDPDLEKAMKLADSVFYDSKGREIKRLHYNEDFERPWIEEYQYSDNGYTKKISGTRDDTTQFYKYSELDKIANKRDIDFEFRDTVNYKYEIDYY